MGEPKSGEPWPTLLKYGNASVLPDEKGAGPSKTPAKVRS